MSVIDNNVSVHLCTIILYTCQETFYKVYCCLLVTKHTGMHSCMRAHTHTHTHTHTPHVLVNTHALNVSCRCICICHFQELSVNQHVNVQEFIWSIQKIFFGYFIFLCVFLKHRYIP